MSCDTYTANHPPKQGVDVPHWKIEDNPCQIRAARVDRHGPMHSIIIVQYVY